MNRLSGWLQTRRVYVFAIGFYVVVAGLSYAPMAKKNHVVAQVSDRLQMVRATLPKGSDTTAVSGEPTSFSIKRLGINLSVKAGTYDANDRAWTLDNTHVFVNTFDGSRSLIASTATLQPDVTVFYGHEIPTVVGNTNDIVEGDMLAIRTTNGYQFDYYFTHSQTVGPTQTDILKKPNATPTVALITCSGLFSESRRIMYFTPLGQPQRIGTAQANL